MSQKVLPRIAAVSAGEKPYTLHIYWEAEGEDIVDVSSLIQVFRIYSPLREAPELFAHVFVGEFGPEVVWTDEIDTLLRLAMEQSGKQIAV